jgi:tetratricopeptide (TPR) repeat protein
MTLATTTQPANDTFRLHLAQGRTLEHMGRYTEALAALGQALRHKPDDGDALNGYRRILEQMPDAAEGLNDLAIALAEWGQIPQALTCFNRAIELSSDFAAAYNNRGLLLKDLGRIEEAISSYRKAVELNPDYANAQWNLALALLLTGQFQEGWQRFGWRHKANLDAILPSQREDPATWKGGPFPGKTLLIRYEQGMGDCLQMVRYLPAVKARGGIVLLEAPRSLMRLLSHIDGVDKVVEALPDGRPQTPCDLHAFIMDLPFIFGTTSDTTPIPIPYIKADPYLSDLWQSQLAGPGMKVGIVWAGSPRHTNDRNRSCPLHHFRTLLEIPCISLFSLQKGPARSQLASHGNWPIVDLADDLADWADTAAAIQNLDLIISVDTGVLHLAGAMGKKVWAILPFVPDWRWMLHREDSPWYPTLRLFRQPTPRDWDSVLAAMGKELRLLHSDPQIPKSKTSPSLEEAYRLVSEGHSRLSSGKVELAAGYFQRAIALHPDFAEAHYNLGVALGELRQLDRAAACYQKAVELNPDLVQARYNLANLYKQTGQLDLAVTHYQKSLQIDPDHWKSLNNLGQTLRIMGRTEQALTYLRRAVRLKSDGYEAYVNLGLALIDCNELEQALDAFEKALTQRPHSAEACCNVGATLNLLGHDPQAIERYEQAIHVQPDCATAHWNRALLLLLTGRFSEGWREYPWRRKIPAMKLAYPHDHVEPLWDGSPFVGQRLLVHYEQGLGDTFQFVRYLPRVKQQGGTVLFETPQPLHGLLKGFPGIDELILSHPEARPDVPFDLHVSLLDLPGIFGTTLETIPAQVPYLYADPDKAKVWKERLKGPDLKVGLVWAGSPRHTGDRLRSCPLACLEPLSRIHGVRLYSLQKNILDAKAPDLLKEMDVTCLGQGFEDFTDTAAAIESLDLVISVDTSVLHLAGAMGRPVWALLAGSPDWRWMLERSDSPWYPTMQLFRQHKDQDWQSVIDLVLAELQRLSAP